MLLSGLSSHALSTHDLQLTLLPLSLLEKEINPRGRCRFRWTQSKSVWPTELLITTLSLEFLGVYTHWHASCSNYRLSNLKKIIHFLRKKAKKRLQIEILHPLCIFYSLGQNSFPTVRIWMQEEEEGAPTNGSADEGNPPPASVPAPSSLEPGDVNPSGVQALGANCHVLCSNNKW